MNWRAFFTNNVNGYLLSDLREMNKIHVDGPGNCGYPMLMTMLSGMELLGGLTHLSEKWLPNATSGEQYFKHFFRTYFAKQHVAYQHSKQASKFYNLLRHKLAHSFLTALNYQVTKNGFREPITHYGSAIVLDVGVMYEHFCRAVKALESDLEHDNVLAQRFESRLYDMASAYGPPTPARTMTEPPTTTTTSGVLTHTAYMSLATHSLPIPANEPSMVSAIPKQIH